MYRKEGVVWIVFVILGVCVFNLGSFSKKIDNREGKSMKRERKKLFRVENIVYILWEFEIW